MGVIDYCSEAEKSLIQNAPDFKVVLDETRKGPRTLREFYVKQYEKTYGKSSIDNLKNPYVGYYRMDAAYASQYQDRSTNPVIVYLKPQIRDKVAFYSYYGTDVDTFLDEVNKGYIIPTIGQSNLYPSEHWDDFFKRWETKLGNDVFPTYSNLIEKIYARDTGVPENDLWKSYEVNLKKALPDLDEIKVDFDRISTDTGMGQNRLLPQNATDYYRERLGRLSMLECKELSDCLLELMKKANVNDRIKHREYMNLARDFTYSTFHIYGSSIFYAKGGPVNAAPVDIDIWKSAFEGVIANSKNKNDRLSSIASVINEFSSHALGVQESKLPFAQRQAKSKQEFNDGYYAMNKDDIVDVRKEKTRLENDIIEKTSLGQGVDNTDLQNKIGKYLQVANQFMDILQDTRLKPYNFVKNAFNLGSTVSALVPGGQLISAGLKLLEGVAEYAQGQESKKMQKESLYRNYQPPFVIFQMGPPHP